MKPERILPILIVVLIASAGAMTVFAGSHLNQAEPAPVPGIPGTAAGVQVELEEVLAGFTQPVHVTNAGDGTDRLFVVERQGRILVADGSEVQPFLDIRDLVGDWFIEQGLFSVAFHPDFSNNGYFYVFYTATPEDEDVNRAGDNTIARFQVDPDNPNRADHDSIKILLAIPDREANHNGGQLLFGPDGYLYAGTGDEGGMGWYWNNSQDPTSYFGKILRVDVDGGDPYSIPADNPFLDDDEYLPEIWAMGLRNPWRFSFDRQTGNLFIGDVGELDHESVNLVPVGESGLNFGWPIMEASVCFPDDEPCDPTGLTQPILSYPHIDGEHVNGCSVTGGFVYRGSEAPFMDGIYVFGDWCSGRVWGASEVDGDWQKHQIGQFPISISSFGEDEQGELYLTDMINGKIQRLHFREPAAEQIDEHPAFATLWARTDEPIAAGEVSRTWMWGPEPVTAVMLEPYLEAPDGERQVQYWDKARMEINDPDSDPDLAWFVTNGLLVTEMMTGRIQTGHTAIDWRAPAEINVAGDPDDPGGVTYAVLAGLMNQPPHSDGSITATLSGDGQTGQDAALAAHGVEAGPLAEETLHRIASVFWEFMTSQAEIFDNGQLVSAPLFENPYYATGLPVTEAYWTQVEVGGTPTMVLLQAFERRALSYTPDNLPGWQVEAGNVGRHYYRWRYGD
jgi:glucose/arabinose dehydrogenase